MDLDIQRYHIQGAGKGRRDCFQQDLPGEDCKGLVTMQRRQLTAYIARLTRRGLEGIFHDREKVDNDMQKQQFIPDTLKSIGYKGINSYLYVIQCSNSTILSSLSGSLPLGTCPGEQKVDGDIQDQQFVPYIKKSMACRIEKKGIYSFLCAIHCSNSIKLSSHSGSVSEQ